VPTKKIPAKKKTAPAKKPAKSAKPSAKADVKKTKAPAKKPAVKIEKKPAVKTPAAKAPVKAVKKVEEKKMAAKPVPAKVQAPEKTPAPSKPVEPPKPQPKPEPTRQRADFAEDILGPTNEAPKDEAEMYDELIAQERERELVRSQRKQTAGKDSGKKGHKKTFYQQPRPVTDRVVEIPEVITVKEFSEKTGLGAAKVIGELMKNGILANINQQIDYDTAQIIADDLGIQIKKKRSEGTAEDVFSGNLEALLKQDEAADLQPRPPIVVVMGHVDHGKTKLLDYIRQTNVVAGEAGGITQHIGAYQVVKNNRKITFLDTPGHEAFTAMRARGAKVTDIAILVVAADEGVKPQTVEALQHAQDAGVPIIVAINKIDKENAAPDRVKGELGEYGLVPEEWGGSTIMVPVSAMTGQGMDTLLEMVLLVADMGNLKANPNREAVGTVIEAHLNPNLGPVATVIVNTGSLKVGDNFVVGSTYGRIKVMKDSAGKNVQNAGPSTPVFIAGLSASPQSGDILHVVPNEQTARAQALNVQTLKEAELLKKRGVGEIMSQISSGQLKQLKLVLKADSKGSLEALKQAINQIKNDMVSVKTVLASVGNVTESDVMMAAAAGGIVMGFHVDVPFQVKKVSEREHVEVLQYTIIYKLLDDIKKILTGLLEPEIIENILGRAEVKKVFMTEKKEMIVGCKVIKGHVENKAKVRVFRSVNNAEEKVGDGQINTLKSFEKNVNEVNEGNDCGIRYEGFMPLMEGDILEAYKMEKRIRTL
jgi:translation initiation factor IF-2